MVVDSQANVAVLEKNSDVVATGGQASGSESASKRQSVMDPPQESTNGTGDDGESEKPKLEEHLCNEEQKESRYEEFARQMLPVNASNTELKLDATTMVFVVAMQNDFVFGSFGMPCKKHQEKLKSSVASLISRASQSGATIVASLDFHPEGHCSFKANDHCKNEFFLTEQDKEKADKRYKNEFPPHTTFREQDGATKLLATPKDESRGWSTEFHGAAIVDSVREALLAASKAHKDKVFEVFAGFRESVESFTAFPFFSADSKAEEGTGGYLPVTEDQATAGTITSCFENEDQKGSCLPSPEQMKDLAKMTRIDKLLDELRKGSGAEAKPVHFDRVLVVGLVYDYSVKETAIALRTYFQKITEKTEVFVVSDYTRPAFEGSGLEPPAAKHGEVALDLEQAGVKFARVDSEDKLLSTPLKWKSSDLDGEKGGAPRAPAALYSIFALLAIIRLI
eukprot:SRR837773.7424.p1 GENE.SRR837773.7424~~SRR837773.7424.p1  ORF type:complete len:504 (+),score=91.95 SRR837773.7424:157-1512(+)